jgi:hypothetical protein
MRSRNYQSKLAAVYLPPHPECHGRKPVDEWTYVNRETYPGIRPSENYTFIA